MNIQAGPLVRQRTLTQELDQVMFDQTLHSNYAGRSQGAGLGLGIVEIHNLEQSCQSAGDPSSVQFSNFDSDREYIQHHSQELETPLQHITES